VKLEDFALLGLGECYILLPEPAVRLSKMKTPEARVLDKNQDFVGIKLCKKNSRKA
jgi:hypothetical protein